MLRNFCRWYLIFLFSIFLRFKNGMRVYHKGYICMAMNRRNANKKIMFKISGIISQEILSRLFRFLLYHISRGDDDDGMS